MTNNANNRGKALTNIMKSDAMVNIGKENLEVFIDSTLDSGVLKDIPLVSTVVGVFNVAGTIRDQLLAAKIIRFLNELSNISQHEINDMVEKLEQNDKFSGKAGSALIEILDRMESETKPEIAAKCFIAYAKKIISYDQLRHMLFSLERIPTFELAKVASFSVASIETSLKIDESTLLTFVNAGLGVNNGGFDGGAILPTNLCKLFVSSGVLS